MELKFSALSQQSDEKGHEAAEREMFEMDLNSEKNERGQPMEEVGPLASAGPTVSESAPQEEQTVQYLVYMLTPDSEEVEVMVPVAAASAWEMEDWAKRAAKERNPGWTVDRVGGVCKADDGAQPVAASNEPTLAGGDAEQDGNAQSGAIATTTQDTPDQESVAAANVSEATAPQAAPENAGKEDPFAALLQLSAGKRAADEVTIDNQPAKTMKMFSEASVEDGMPSEEDEQFLVDAVKRGVEQQAQRTAESAALAGGAPVVAAAAAGVPAAVPQFSTTVGSVLGRAAGEVIATPFIALSSAAKHLTQRFGKPVSPVPAGPGHASRSMAASLGVSPSPAIINTLEKISQWKCDRIEKAANDVAKTALALAGTEEFVVWEEKVQKVAEQLQQPVSDVVARMHEDESLAELKTGMDSLWTAYPDKVAAYRKASEDFVRNINTVIKEFPNSDDATKERVANAMKNVEEKTQLLPGFGQDIGEYQRTIAERVREIAKVIAEFVQQLFAKLSGRAPTVNDELTV